MNRKQLLILLIAGAALGALALSSIAKRGASYQRGAKAAGEAILGDPPGNEPAFISIKSSTNEVTLVKTDQWRVKERDEYPANAATIVELGRKLWSLKAAQTHAIGPSQLGRVGLLSPQTPGTNSGTLIELKDKDQKLIAALLLGRDTVAQGESAPNGRWVQRPETAGTAYLVSEPMTEFVPNPATWLNKEFLKVDKIKSVAVTHLEATNSWKLFRESDGGELKLADATTNEMVDASRVSGIGYALNSPYVSDVVSLAAKPEETGLDRPIVAVIETFEGFTYTGKLGKITPDDSNRHFQISVTATFEKARTAGVDEKPEDKEKLDKEFQENLTKLEEKLKKEQAYAKWTYLISKWSVDPLAKERKELLAEKKPEETPAMTPVPPVGGPSIQDLLNPLAPLGGG